MTTIVIKRHYRLSNELVLHAGDELGPSLIDQSIIDALLDQDVLVETPSRLSYFALLPDFADAAPTERLDVASLFPTLAIPRLDSPGQKSDKVSPS
jgi:hypothetical protein